MSLTVAPIATRNAPVERYLTKPGQHPFNAIEWEERTAEIGKKFRQEGVEFPRSWSQTATNIVAEKYFAKGMGERSVKQMVNRVAERIAEEGIRLGYFPGIYEGQRVGTPGTDNHPATIFYHELCHILVNQLAAFNSPVWFNVGVDGRKQQCSACFILSIKDSMDSILHWYTQEGKIFKGGSGSGINISNLRGSRETLSTGGIASGPVSFMRAADANAGTIKSGGMTRRAAKMVLLDAEHPDVLEFIQCKAREEERLFKLIAAGEQIGIGGDDPEVSERNLAEVTSFQNANNSVRVTDEFMRLATGHRNGPDWSLVARNDGSVTERVRAAELLDEIAKAAWRCGDPGLQFATTIDDMHTTPAQGRINASNPCSEYLSNDDTSCNLASLNLLKFVTPEGNFDTRAYEHVVDVMALAMDILVGFAYYPGDEEGELLGERTRKMRQLGLGYANLGGLLMRLGIAYDSQDGRELAGSLASLLTARVYCTSARLAEAMGPFEHFPENRESMLAVVQRHGDHAADLADTAREGTLASEIAWKARQAWLNAYNLGGEHGYRNAQASVMAPTGTISFLLDCDTTGVEPDLALVKYKTLAGGGTIKTVNRLIEPALESLGYSHAEVHRLALILEQSGEETFFEELNPRHRAVFATAIGVEQVAPEGHIKMLGAIQPHISGGISKTVNVREETTWEEIREMYALAWKEGVKCLAIYRDNSKAMQAMSTKPKVEALAEAAPAPEPERLVQRERLPRKRDAEVVKFGLGQHSGFLTVGRYPDGRPGEVFVSGLGQEGSTVSGLAGAWAKAISMMLQYGVPVEEIESSFAHIRFEPEGITGVQEVPFASSLPDFVARYLASAYCTPEVHEVTHVHAIEDDTPHGLRPGEAARMSTPVSTGKTCSRCGGMMQRTGSCYTCSSCGDNTGCG